MIKKIILSALLVIACAFAKAQSQNITHVVMRGETIESIANHYNVSVEDINKANPNIDGIIYVGMKLIIPTDLSLIQGEVKVEKTRENENMQNNSHVSQTQVHNSSRNIINDKNDTKLGFQLARVKASYLFPTKLEKSTRGHYRSSYNLSFIVEGEYVFNPNLFAGIGLGYMVQGSCNSDKEGFNYQQCESQYHYIMLPLSFGYRMPITKSIHFDAYTGPTFTGIVSGYSKYRANTNEDWNKTKLKDMKNVKYFTPFWNIGARVNLWDFELGAEYWYLLTKTNEGGSKRAIAAHFALHF